MKIVIIEPLGITPEKLAEATAAVKARGHEIVAYDTKEEDQDKLAERGKDADIIIIANQPFRKNVIQIFWTEQQSHWMYSATITIMEYPSVLHP